TMNPGRVGRGCVPGQLSCALVDKSCTRLSQSCHLFGPTTEHGMGATLTEVAQAAGVSLATASRAFKDPERLAAGTRDRVLKAAAELRYDTQASVATRT